MKKKKEKKEKKEKKIKICWALVEYGQYCGRFNAKGVGIISVFDTKKKAESEWFKYTDNLEHSYEVRKMMDIDGKCYVRTDFLGSTYNFPMHGLF